MRVGIIGLQHESNTFLAARTTIEDFRRGHLLLGEDIRSVYTNSHHEVGGFFCGLAEAGIVAAPLLAAWTCPSGVIEDVALETLLHHLFSALDEAGPLDGLLVAPHGAAVSETHRDMDGYWISRIRERVGTNVPIICTVDLHANLSRQMVNACDAIIAYRTNPHLDQFERGIEAARLMGRTLREEVHPTQQAVFPPIAINIERQDTSQLPCTMLYDAAEQVRSEDGVLSCSAILGFPYADVEEMGSTFVVVTNADPTRAQTAADRLAKLLVNNRQSFVGVLVSVEDAMKLAAGTSGPVCLLDMGDNVGGGSPADGTFLLHAAYQGREPRFFVCIYDPESSKQAAAQGVGGRVHLQIGGKSDDRHGAPLAAMVTVRSLHDGKFTDGEVRHGGQTFYDMGNTAIVTTDRGQTVMLTSQRIAPYSLGQLTSCGLDPSEFRIIVAKGVHAPVAAYRPVCETLIRVNTAGVTQADMTALDYRHRRHPLFPFEEPICSKDST